MTALDSNEPRRQLAPRRVEHVALGGLALQAICIIFVPVLSAYSSSAALKVMLVQVIVSACVWLISFFHLRMRRADADERRDRLEAERRRQSQGMESLFDEEEEGPAARNLRHMERYIAPGVGLLMGLMLLAPVVYLVAANGPAGMIAALENAGRLNVTNPLAMFFACMFPAFFCFVLGMYAAGLSREKGASLLRAGAGNMIATAVFLGLSGLTLALSQYEWIGAWPDVLLAGVVLLWIVLQGVEIIVNFVLDFYRPRLAGVETRPGYDSRLSGLLAEPQGIFRTFAHTMDYQFGFKVSETWFFRFLEKALAPLILIQLAAFYLLTCLVVVEPGQAAIIERWGAPRGVSMLPDRDADWDNLETPLGPGLHLKWPWPIEIARIYDFERVNTVSVGYTVKDEAEAREKADKLAATVITWDAEHVKGEIHYLMPLPEDINAGAKTGTEKRETVRARGAGDAAAPVPMKKVPDALMLSGEFVIRYRIGTDKARPGDLYRYAYGYKDPRRVIRAVFEREVTAFLAGADFWDVLSREPVKLRRVMLARLNRTVREEELGIEIVSLNIHNLHPPAGEVGKAFENVLASRQEREAEIYAGQTEAIKTEHMIPSQVNSVITGAMIYRTRRELVAAGEADRFLNQVKAYNKAPRAYRMRVRMRALEEALEDARKTVIPRSVVSVIDNSKVITPDMVEIQKGVVKAGENP